MDMSVVDSQLDSNLQGQVSSENPRAQDERISILTTRQDNAEHG